ncbi:TonB-dependent receptor [soil metagenome]
MKLNKLARSLALIGLGSQLMVSAFAQSTDTVQKVERVEITGSSIKRIQDEGALPVQVIKAADLVKQGITSAEQLISRLSANGNGQDNLASNQGGDFLNSLANKAHNNGSSAASLRGLGAQYTLVLLNGRRLSTHGLNGQSVDLNSIPFGAIDRVEILKDGASSLYGTDAVGGVINFILKKDYRGFEATLSTDTTQHGGGDINGISAIFGAGDLERDRFNIIASLAMDKQTRLRGADRDFVNGNQPERGLAPDTTGTPFANLGVRSGTAINGNFVLPGDTVSRSRLGLLNLQGKCETIPDMYAYRGDVTGSTSFSKACAYDYGKQWSLMQPVEHTNFVGKASFKVNKDTTAFIEAVASRTKSAVEYTPIQLTGNAYRYPAGGAYYQDLATLAPTFFRKPTDPADGRVVFDASKPEIVRWRCLPCGPRQQNTTTDAQRVLAGLDGEFAGWDYKLGLSTASSKANTVYGEGNMFDAKLVAAMASGKVNPFLMPGQSQTAEAMQLLSDASARGNSLYGGKASVTQFDGVMSKELFALPAGNVIAAFGFDSRKETYRYTDGTPQLDSVNGVTAVPSLDKVSRRINAIYTEFAIPVIKDLDLTLSARRDNYSDFGSTTNPKGSLRWQPSKEVLFRGSVTRGFHAPDFDSLYGGNVSGQFNSDINDPVLCPKGVETVPGSQGCGIRPGITTVSNPTLKPEKSKQWSLGVAVSPAPWIAASLDYWNIQIDNRIAALSGLTLINNYDRYKSFVKRDPATQEITEVVAPFFNLAGDKTDGVDINVTLNFKTDVGNWLATFDGTYTNSYKSRFSPNDPYVERINDFGGPDFGYDLKLRWKHSASLTWSGGNWSSTLSQNYSNGYNQEVGGYSGFTPPTLPAKVSSYALYNLSVNYSGIKNLSLTAGIKNLFDTKPPFSGHNVDNVGGAGWDSRVGDPRLRAFTLRANYKFW